MSEDNKISKAQQKAVNKYVKNNYDRINVTFPKGQKEILKEHAQKHEESVNAFIVRSVMETMERDNQSSELPKKKSPSPDPDHGTIDAEPFGSVEAPSDVSGQESDDHPQLTTEKQEASALQEEIPSTPFPASGKYRPEDKPEKSETLAEKLDRLCRERNIRSPYAPPDTRRHTRPAKAETEPAGPAETLEEKLERLSKSHPLKTDGVVQRP